MLIPVFDDWDAAGLLCRELDRAAEGLKDARIRVYLVDDGSAAAPPAAAFGWPAQSVRSIASVRLRRNVGHQRAIALGLAYLYDKTDSSAVLVMDGDGEDKATDAIALVRHHLSDPTRIIFASRRRRLEGRVFRVGYTLYRACHRVLTGIEVRIGNFSIVPRPLVGAIVVSSESWSHYAASVVKARLPFTTVPIDRGERLAGRSRMNYVTLVTHGLSAMSVFRELVGTRLLIASTAAAAADRRGDPAGARPGGTRPDHRRPADRQSSSPSSSSSHCRLSPPASSWPSRFSAAGINPHSSPSGTTTTSSTPSSP